MEQLLLVFIGGGFGSVLRFLIGKWLNSSENGIPYGTFAANILGSLLIGIILGAITPPIVSPLVCYILFVVKKPRDSFGEFYSFGGFYESLLNYVVKLPTFISLSAIGNLAIFFILL